MHRGDIEEKSTIESIAAVCRMERKKKRIIWILNYSPTPSFILRVSFHIVGSAINQEDLTNIFVNQASI